MDRKRLERGGVSSGVARAGRCQSIREVWIGGLNSVEGMRSVWRFVCKHFREDSVVVLMMVVGIPTGARRI